MMNQPPTDIKAKRGDGVLQVSWPDGGVAQIPFKVLRCQCTCAECVDEYTGVRRLDPANVPDDVSVQSMELVGAYALRIVWTDGHETGLYTWGKLRELTDAKPL